MKIRINEIEIESDCNVKLDYEDERTLLINEKLILATCETTGQAINVLGALRAIRLNAMFEMATTVHTLLECSEYADQSSEMLQTAINTMTENGGDASEWSEMQAILDARKVMAEVQYEWDHQ